MKKPLFVLSLLVLSQAQAAPELTSRPDRALDVPVWKNLLEKAADFFPEGTPSSHYYELLKEKNKELKSLRGAVMGLIETSEFHDPWENWRKLDRVQVYEQRRHDLGDPSSAALELVQQLALENMAAEFASALPLAEKLHFAEVRKEEAYYDPDSDVPVEHKFGFSPDEEKRLGEYCTNAVKLARFLEMLPGGDEYKLGIEKSNALLMLFYAAQGQRERVAHSFCTVEFLGWPRLVWTYGWNGAIAHNLWNFSLPDFENPLDADFYIYDEHEFFFLKWKTRKKGFEEDKDRYQAATSCGDVEIEGARSPRAHENRAYPYFDPRYRWASPIDESCRSPAGGVNYNDSKQVMSAWARRVRD